VAAAAFEEVVQEVEASVSAVEDGEAGGGEEGVSLTARKLVTFSMVS
jgi:hypothetical protein